VNTRAVVTIVAATAAVSTFMVVSGMGPELVLVAALGCLVGTAVWQLRELADDTPTTATTTADQRVAPPARGDRRVMRLRTGLAYGRPDGPTLERLHATLVEAIDDQLRAVHHVDRTDDPLAARALVGDELQAFVDDPDAAASLANPRTLDRTLTLIERL
jgi:hypothetical protein